MSAPDPLYVLLVGDPSDAGPEPFVSCWSLLDAVHLRTEIAESVPNGIVILEASTTWGTRL